MILFWIKVCIIALTICLTIAYSIWILFILYKWKILKNQSIPADSSVLQKFSILIPFKNEALHISQCIESLLNQDYPHSCFELILINDHSNDNCAEIVTLFSQQSQNLQLLNQEDGLHGKKAAIQTGFSIAQNSWIITTDADTVRHSNWLSTLNNFIGYYPQSDVIMMPVVMKPFRNKLFHYFQALDFSGTLLISVVAARQGWFHNASGANLAIHREVYAEYLQSGLGSGQISGDDTFLAQFVQPDKITFGLAKGLIAYTPTELTWPLFWNQRIRWASKSFEYKNYTMTWMWAMIWMMHVGMVILILISVLKPMYFIFFLFLLGAKLSIDWALLKNATAYFSPENFKYFLPAQFIHMYYVLKSGFHALLKTRYNWKGNNNA